MPSVTRATATVSVRSACARSGPEKRTVTFPDELLPPTVSWLPSTDAVTSVPSVPTTDHVPMTLCMAAMRLAMSVTVRLHAAPVLSMTATCAGENSMV